MRLVDADENREKFMKTVFCALDNRFLSPQDKFVKIMTAFDNLTTSYDVDQVVDDLEYYRKDVPDDKDYYSWVSAIDTAIETVKQGGVSDDVCEWESDYKFISDKYKRVTGCGHEFYDLHHAVPFKYCPYCGKKIKVGAENDD